MQTLIGNLTLLGAVHNGRISRLEVLATIPLGNVSLPYGLLWFWNRKTMIGSEPRLSVHHSSGLFSWKTLYKAKGMRIENKPCILIWNYANYFWLSQMMISVQQYIELIKNHIRQRDGKNWWNLSLDTRVKKSLTPNTKNIWIVYMSTSLNSDNMNALPSRRAMNIKEAEGRNLMKYDLPFPGPAPRDIWQHQKLIFIYSIKFV